MDRRKVLMWAMVGVAVVAVLVAVMRPARPDSGDIGNEELRRLQQSGAMVIDVRTPGEFKLGHISGAQNVPLDQLTSAAAAWPKDKQIVVYCATGARSLNASQWLTTNGWTSVYNLKSGIVAWDGETSTEDAAPAAAFKTNGKPVFIDFYSPT